MLPKRISVIMTFMYSRKERNGSGQVLAMGAVDFMIVVMVTIGLILLMLNCGLAVLTKQQIAFAANAGAEFAAENNANPGVVGLTQDRVRTILRQMGRRAPRDVSVRRLTFSDQVAWAVTVTDNANLIASGQWLPTPQSFSDTGVALQNNNLLLGIGAGPDVGVDSRAHDRNLWLPVVKPPVGSRPGYLYQPIIGSSLCTHGTTPFRNPVGSAIPAIGLNQVTPNDPR